MEGHCSTGQSPQRAVAPTEEEEELDYVIPDLAECEGNYFGLYT